MTNQNPDILHAAKVLEDESKVEFIVYSDLYMTPSAKYADIYCLKPAFRALECGEHGELATILFYRKKSLSLNLSGVVTMSGCERSLKNSALAKIQ